MLHGAQDKDANITYARDAEEKHYAGALRSGTDAPPTPQRPASDWIAQDLSFIHQTQQQTINTLHDLHAKLLGPVKPLPACDTKKNPSGAGVLAELGLSLGVLKEQQLQISTLSEIICRAI